jgi:hypothetical protein
MVGKDEEIARLRAEVASLTERLDKADAELELCAARKSSLGADPFWTKVIGGEYPSTGTGIPVKHIHPAHVKPVFDAARGTAVADVIAGLLFQHMMAWNNAQHAWKRVKEFQDRLDGVPPADGVDV